MKQNKEAMEAEVERLNA